MDALKGWRLAVGTWQLGQGAICVTQNRVLPAFRPPDIS